MQSEARCSEDKSKTHLLANPWQIAERDVCRCIGSLLLRTAETTKVAIGCPTAIVQTIQIAFEAAHEMCLWQGLISCGHQAGKTESGGGGNLRGHKFEGVFIIEITATEAADRDPCAC